VPTQIHIQEVWDISLGHEAEQSTEVNNKWSYASALLLLRGVALNQEQENPFFLRI
jgi:hypothetical protein